MKEGDHIAILKRFKPFGVPSKNCFVLVAKGHNMSPAVVNGSLIIGVKGDYNSQDGDIVILSRGGDYACKYKRVLPDGTVFYENAVGEFFDGKYYRIFGTVTGVFNTLKK